MQDVPRAGEDIAVPGQARPRCLLSARIPEIWADMPEHVRAQYPRAVRTKSTIAFTACRTDDGSFLPNTPSKPLLLSGRFDLYTARDDEQYSLTGGISMPTVRREG